MNEKENDFLQDHSLRYLEMALGYEKRQRVQNPDGYGKRTGECGDTVEMFVSMDGDHIQFVSFDTDGCMSTHACANTVSHLGEGKAVEEAWEISPEEVIEFLETLPEENHHCAELAAGAFYKALANYQELKRSPWKRPYQNKR